MKCLLLVVSALGLGSCQSQTVEAEPSYLLHWWAGRPVVVQETREGLVTVSAASDTGKFKLDEHCLTLEIGGRQWTPIFPANARLMGDARAISFGEFLASFETEYGLENIAINMPVPRTIVESIRHRGCPTDFAYFSGVETVARPARRPAS